MAKKSGTILVRLQSTAKTGYFYLSERNTRNTPEKISRMKYDPVIRRRVLFIEKKI